MRILHRLRDPGIVLLTMLVVVGVAIAIHEVKPSGYTAEAVLVVPANSADLKSVSRSLKTTYQGPGLAQEANALAVTFGGLIPNDQAILQTASRRLGRSPIDVQGRLTVVNDASTSLLHVRYQGASRAEALLGASTIAEAVSGNHPASTAIPPGALMLIRLPSTTTSAYTLATLLGVAAVLGFALGVLLVVVRNRANPRIRAPRDAEDLLHVPVTAARWLSGEDADNLLRDWYDTAVGRGRTVAGSVATVALLATSKRAVPDAHVLAAWLSSSHARPRRRLPGASGSAPTPPPGAGRRSPVRQRRGLVDVSVIARHRRRRDIDLRAIADHDVVVLVITAETSARRVSLLVDLVAEIGREPDAAILVGRRLSHLSAGGVPEDEPRADKLPADEVPAS